MRKPPECAGCPLETLGRSFSQPEGRGTLHVAIIGEALGQNEANDGLPFRPYADAGSKLEEVFRLAGVTREQFLLWNVVACQPPGNRLDGANYELAATSHCRVHFDRVMRGFSGAILALGNVALRSLTGLAGDKLTVSHLRGYVLPSRYGPVVPSYHPSFIRRGNPQYTPVLVEDLRKAIGVASGSYTSYEGHPSYRPPQYITNPGVDQAIAFYNRCKDNSQLPIAYDIETPTSKETEEDERDEIIAEPIISIQFSLDMGEGIAFPWREPYIKIAKDILALPNTKAGHNVWIFDNPKLEANGVRICGTVHDTMWMFHHFHSKLDKGIQKVVSLLGFPFPWKHLDKSNPEFYGCADVDAVQYILHRLPKLMTDLGIWKGYTRHKLKLHPILKRAQDRGIPVDESLRQQLEKEFRAKQKELDDELQELIPPELRNIEPKRKRRDGFGYDYGYLREPSEVAALRPEYRMMCIKLEQEGKKPISFEEYAAERTGLVLRRFAAISSDSLDIEHIYRWCRIKPFKASKDQIARYIRWKAESIKDKKLSKLYTVPLALKTRKETTGKKDLEDLYFRTGDEVFAKILEIRSVTKMLTNDLPNWKPEQDGKVHTTFNFGPPTGQLASRRPNIQNVARQPANVISGSEYGQKFRRIIVAIPGHIFLEFDYTNFHVVIMGREARDERYMRFGQLGIMHDFVTSYVVKEPIDPNMSEGDIIAACRDIKARYASIRNNQVKPTVLGNQLGLGAVKLQRMNRLHIATVQEAKRLQSILAELFPKVHQYKDWIRDQANQKKYLLSDFWGIQHFYEVFTYRWSKKMNCWLKSSGTDSERAVAYKIQSNAFGIVNEAILQLHSVAGALDEYGFINTVHDSLIFMPEKEKADKCIETVYKVMTQPWQQLACEICPDGLAVNVEIKAGSNMMAWSAEHNPDGMREIKI
jgi:uracil-DNA glycosylase family 4